MLKPIAKIAIALGVLTTLGLGITAASVAADTVDTTPIITTASETALEDQDLTLEEMLTYAMQDEYDALASYQAIVAQYGEVRPFTNLIVAETTHISLLTPLFETYGVALVNGPSSSEIVVPATLTESLTLGREAELANIAMYEKFLASDLLPEDVQVVFEQLLAASNRHLNALSRGRFVCFGQDMAAKIKNMFRYKGSNGNQGQGQGTQNGSNYSGTNGTCTKTW